MLTVMQGMARFCSQQYVYGVRVSPTTSGTFLVYREPSVITNDKCKNEVGCRDDTVPKPVDTRRHCEVRLRACKNLPQPQNHKI